jgi:hypothetical protein
MLSTIVKSFINSNHGWAVANQFEDTFDNGESLESQNKLAMSLVRSSVWDILESNVLSGDAKRELKSYLDELDYYLKG